MYIKVFVSGYFTLFFPVGTKYSDETVNECEKKLTKLTDAYCDCLPDRILTAGTCKILGRVEE